MSLTDALAGVVAPGIRAVFHDEEATAISVTFDPALLGGSITLSLAAVGEDFSDLLVQGDVTGYSVDERTARGA